MSIPIEQHPSPNHSSRHGADISMLVLHATVGSYVSALAWLTSPQSRVSSHYLIRKDGHVAQLVQDDRAAWHAGDSFWHGLDSKAIQYCSIGIELENANTGKDPYPPAQLRVTHDLCQSLISRYNIERADVVRHLDIAIPKGRKTDPAGFPWPEFADGLYLPSFVERRYKVKQLATGGALIRSAPRTNAAILGHLHAGDPWTGEAIPGQVVSIAGFGSSNQWIRDSQMRCVSSVLLEEVT
jgi:N-acetyl-anhydromuramyl-L-alanine amidase AmpD